MAKTNKLAPAAKPMQKGLQSKSPAKTVRKKPTIKKKPEPSPEPAPEDQTIPVKSILRISQTSHQK